MNKTPIITIIALLTVILIAFTGCEFEISLNGEENNTQTSIESVVVTDEEGSTQIETVVHYITTEPVPVVTVIEVTNEKGKVVETEKVTLSPEEVQQGKDFFNGKDDDKETNKETTKETNKKPNKETNKDTTKETSKVTEKETEVSKDPAPDRVTTAPDKENVKVQDDLAVLKSSRYLIEGRVVTADGVSYPYKMARDGSRFTFKSVYEGEEICIIVGSKYVYLVSPETKTYAKVSKELVEDEATDSEDFDDLLTGDAFNLYANKNEIDTYTEKMYGVKYKVIEYDDGTRDFFNGKTLVMTEASDGSILYYDTISSNVSEGLFVPPADYSEEVVTTTSSASTTECTDPEHNH
ncbi:MAG: hypothetical protein IJN94_00025 [Clostridia bacterium]|nr:hypothetical protein [Clostridia bacterium]